MSDQVRMCFENFRASGLFAWVLELLSTMCLEMVLKLDKVGILITASRAVVHHPVVYSKFRTLALLLGSFYLTQDQELSRASSRARGC